MSSRFSRLYRTVLLSTTLAAMAVPAMGGELMPPGKPPEQRNAALVYYRSWIMLDDATLKADIDWNAIGTNTDPAKMPEVFTKTAETVAAWDDSIQGLIRASRMPICDFELAYEQGFAMIMPHLSKFRGGARMLRVDARRLLMEGKPAESAQRVAAMLRMSRQLKDDGILISSLVGMAVATAGLDEGDALIRSGKLAKADAKEIAAAVASLSGPDSLGVRSSITGEGAVLKSWISSQFNTATGGKDFNDNWLKATEGDQPSPSHVVARESISKMNGEQLVAETDRVVAGYALLNKSWDAPDAVKQFDQVSERATKGEFGALGVVIFPSFGKSRASVAKFEARLAEFSKNLSALR